MPGSSEIGTRQEIIRVLKRPLKYAKLSNPTASAIARIERFFVKPNLI